MFLAIDIGNTNIKAGLFNGDSLKGYFISHDIENFISSVSQYEIKASAFTSVSPSKTEKFLRYFKKYFSIAPYQITHNSTFNLKIEYSTPETLGIDRICSSEGAYRLFNKTNSASTNNDFIISVDFGTATTINIIQSNGIFSGGLILPGIQMMFESLSKQTEQLPLVTETEYIGFVGSSTKSSIASGTINSITGLLEKVNNDLRNNMNANSVLFYTTGGNAERINKYLTVKFEYIKELVLVGVNEIYKKNSSSN